MKDVSLIKQKRGRRGEGFKDCIRQKKRHPKSTTQKYFCTIKAKINSI